MDLSKMSPEMLELIRSKLSPDERAALDAELTARTTANNRVTMKVSDKGAISVYGLGRFPVTLHHGQWQRLLSEPVEPELRKFLKDNENHPKVAEARETHKAKKAEGRTTVQQGGTGDVESTRVVQG